MQKTYSVYFLRDPRSGCVRYIGITSDVKHRLNAHVNTTAYSSCVSWSQELRSVGMSPLMTVVFSGLTVWQAQRCESILMQKHEANPDIIGSSRNTRTSIRPDRQLQIALDSLRHVTSESLLLIAEKARQEYANRLKTAKPTVRYKSGVTPCQPKP